MGEYLDKLKSKMDEYVHFVYKISRSFPKKNYTGQHPNFGEPRFLLF